MNEEDMGGYTADTYRPEAVVYLLDKNGGTSIPYTAQTLMYKLKELDEYKERIKTITNYIQDWYDADEVSLEEVTKLVKELKLNVSVKQTAEVTVVYTMKLNSNPNDLVYDALDNVNFNFDEDLIEQYDISRAYWSE